MQCPACRAERHEECYSEEGFNDNIAEGDICCCDSLRDESIFSPVPSPNKYANGKSPFKDDDDASGDRVSRGRKRAANLYPISEGMECEWSGLARAGGGVIPIIGCQGNILTASKVHEPGSNVYPGHIHHGPDKDTINNGPDNISRVCSTCHNRWHALNNPYYAKERPEVGEYVPLTEYYPLDKNTKATEQQFQWNELYWKMPAKQKETIPYRTDLT